MTKAKSERTPGEEDGGRLAGLKVEARFNERNIEEYPEIQRWKKKIRHVDDEYPKPTTWERVFRPAIVQYCNWLGKTPSEIVADRRATFMMLGDEQIRRTHEEHYDRFAEHVKGLTKKSDRRKKLASWTVNTKLVAVRSFYKRNYYPLIEVEGVRAKAERLFHIPSAEELGRMVLACEDTVYSTAMLAQAQSGLGEAELLSVSWEQESPDLGTVRKQLDSGADYVHLRFDRGKTGVTFDTFFGPETLRWMRKSDFPKGRSAVFDFHATTWQQRVRKVQAKAGIPGIVTPHCLRKFFSNQLRLSRVNDSGWDPLIIEYWMGHGLGHVKEAYFVPPVSEQVRLRILAEPRLIPVYPPATYTNS